MGLISQIEKKRESKIKNAIESPPVRQPESVSTKPAPCPTCRSPILWLDRYGGEPHCVACQPPPSKSLVARQCEIVTEPDGSFAWEDGRATGGTAEARYAGGELGSDADFDRRYRCYTSRDGKREIIERRDWTFLNAMILD